MRPRVHLRLCGHDRRLVQYRHRFHRRNCVRRVLQDAHHLQGGRRGGRRPHSPLWRHLGHTRAGVFHDQEVIPAQVPELPEGRDVRRQRVQGSVRAVHGLRELRELAGRQPAHAARARAVGHRHLLADNLRCPVVDAHAEGEP